MRDGSRNPRGPNQGPSKDDLKKKVEDLEAKLINAEKRSLDVENPVSPPEVGGLTDDTAQSAVSNAQTSVKPAGELPKILQERAKAIETLTDQLMGEIEKFKGGEAYLEGDLPVFLHGLSGPGFAPGQRKLNWIDPRHVDPMLHVRWSNKRMVDYHRGDGFAPLDRKDFDTMTIARGGKYSFQTSPEGHVQSGDLILVATSQSWYKQLQKRNADKTRKKESRVKDTLCSKGKELGMEVDDGVGLGPKAKRILELLEKELGPEAKALFVG